MTDVVWIELTKGDGVTRQSFMFGPTGVTSFVPNTYGQTLLYIGNGPNPIIVLEKAKDIMSIIAKVRGTIGILTRKNKKTKGKSNE
jgi:hypothetical protein